MLYRLCRSAKATQQYIKFSAHHIPLLELGKLHNKTISANPLDMFIFFDCINFLLKFLPNAFGDTCILFQKFL